ncbi:MAG: pentapeptide repeat-containing protein [Nannocystaceae bacterium]|nr:pentapeptide repeat-containing protein [Nannocystaceae bacterium]
MYKRQVPMCGFSFQGAAVSYVLPILFPDLRDPEMRSLLPRFLGLLPVVLASACIGSPSSDSATDEGTTSNTKASTTAGETSSSGRQTTTSPTDPSASSNPGTTDTLPPGSGCCTPHEGPGCDEAAVQECVCDMDTSCCGFDWRDSCVEVAQARCEATCAPDATTGDTASTSGPTTGVSTSPGTTGFGDTGFGDTGFGDTGFGDTGFGDDLCCYPGQGCEHPATDACVCAIDSSCCDGEWSETCVGLAETDCNACTSDDCCAPQNDAGCSDMEVLDCVCDADSYCCDTEYDYICAEIASTKCGACGD